MPFASKGPDFFSADEEAFERDLTDQTGTGFFLKHPIWCDPTDDWAPVDRSAKATEIRDHHATRARKLHLLQLREFELAGLDKLEIDRILKNENQIKLDIEARRIGYASWLATDALFRTELHQLREKWGKEVLAVRDFPGLDVVILNRPLYEETRFTSDAIANFIPFYHRWGLSRLATWDLPIPMHPDSAIGTAYGIDQMRDAGLVLFLPYYLFRDQKFNLHHMAKHNMSCAPPTHLQSWFNRGKNWGHRRFGAMFWIYIFFELAIKVRYSERVNGATEKLDFAFQQYFSSKQEVDSCDTVRRVRLELNRLLRKQSVQEISFKANSVA